MLENQREKWKEVCIIGCIFKISIKIVEEGRMSGLKSHSGLLNILFPVDQGNTLWSITYLLWVLILRTFTTNEGNRFEDNYWIWAQLGLVWIESTTISFLSFTTVNSIDIRRNYQSLDANEKENAPRCQILTTRKSWHLTSIIHLFSACWQESYNKI